MGIDYTFAPGVDIERSPSRKPRPIASLMSGGVTQTGGLGERPAAVSNPRIIHNLMRLPSNGSSSSDSECEPDSVCLAEMVNEFLEDGFGDPIDSKQRNGFRHSYGFSSTKGTKNDFGVDYPMKSLKALVRISDPFEKNLACQVSSIVDSYADNSATICGSGPKHCSGSCLRRFVKSCLRANGYNAAVCKSRWSHTRNSPGGEYEYIDVIPDGKCQRLIVDVDFAGQFHITRPTPQYLSSLEIVPSVFVGSTTRLLQIVDIMTEEAKISLKSKEMHLPPWRKLQYMRLKWLSPYMRTADELSRSVGYKCRKPGAIVNQIGDKGTENSPILLEVQALNDDPLHYGGRVFCLKEECLQGGADCKCNENTRALRREPTDSSTSDNLLWKLPSVSSTPKVRAGLSTCLKQSELAKQLKAAAAQVM